MPLNTGNMGGVGDLVRALTGRDAGPEMAEVMPLLRKVPGV